MAEFIFKRGMELITYTKWEDVPENLDFDHIIKFVPEIPPEPHTEEEHKELEQWHDRFKTLMEKERARSREKK
jgi:hypothetical protein|tara:strand:+ start:866 stop:1084 length:219 start_codon:yes stop_codon:yes gene_type:complete